MEIFDDWRYGFLNICAKIFDPDRSTLQNPLRIVGILLKKQEIWFLICCQNSCGGMGEMRGVSPLVVIIEKAQIRPAGIRCAKIQGETWSVAICFIAKMKKAAFAFVGQHKGDIVELRQEGSIGSIVYNDDLGPRILLHQYRIDRPQKQRGPVARGDDHRKQRGL